MGQSRICAPLKIILLPDGDWRVNDQQYLNGHSYDTIINAFTDHDHICAFTEWRVFKLQSSQTCQIQHFINRKYNIQLTASIFGDNLYSVSVFARSSHFNNLFKYLKTNRRRLRYNNAVTQMHTHTVFSLLMQMANACNTLKHRMGYCQEYVHLSVCCIVHCGLMVLDNQIDIKQ